MSNELTALASATLDSIDHGFQGGGALMPRALNALDRHGLTDEHAISAAFVISDLIRDDIVGAVEIRAEELMEAVRDHPVVGGLIRDVLNAADRYTEPLALATLLATSLGQAEL